MNNDSTENLSGNIPGNIVSPGDRPTEPTLQPPAQFDSSQTPKPRSRKKLILVLVLVFVVLAGSYGAVDALTDTKLPVEFFKKSEPSAQSSVSLTTYEDKKIGIKFTYPASWQVEDLSSDLGDSYYLEISSPENDSVVQQLSQKYGIDIRDQTIEFPDENQINAINDPIATNYGSVSIKINRAPTFTIEKNIDEWRQIAESANSSGLGVSLSGFMPITVSGFSGYKYTSSITLGSLSAKFTDYTIVTPNSRLEISVFPYNSKYSTIADQIVDSITLK